MMAAVMRWAGESEAVRRDLVMGVLLIAETDMSRFTKSKSSLLSRLMMTALRPNFGRSNSCPKRPKADVYCVLALRQVAPGFR